MSKQLLNTDSTHRLSLAAVADRAWTALSEAAFKTGFKPLATICEAAAVALMKNISVGYLRIVTDSHIYTFPAVASTKNTEPAAELRVKSDAFWIRLCAMNDLGFSEAYMYGEVECDDLVSLFGIFFANKDQLSSFDSESSLASYLLTIPQKLTSYRFLNSISNSRSNISAHYDISNDMFKGFLSEDMTYSCAIFEDLDSDIKSRTDSYGRSNGSRSSEHLSADSDVKGSLPAPKSSLNHPDPLYIAQVRKLDHIICKARIFPNQRVLEIGSGWGALAIRLAETIPGTTIDTLTLSSQQQVLACKRIAAAGLEDRIHVHLMDYRKMPREWAGAFDRFISVEMIEAVGKEYMQEYWEVVDWALKKEDAVGVVQVITIPEPRFERYLRHTDFIQKWVIFPGAMLPSLTFLVDSMCTGSSGRLILDSASNIGPHYARTLREWRRRFEERFEDVIVPALVREHGDVMGGPRGREEIEVFRRKWIYYYCYCEIGFTTRTLGDHIITFTREGCMDFGCDVYA